MQKYRADYSEPQKDGSKAWYAKWLGGPTLAKVTDCRLNMAGTPRRAVYVTGEPDTWFSIPASTRYMGKRVKGYLTNDDDGFIFHHVYYE